MEQIVVRSEHIHLDVQKKQQHCTSCGRLMWSGLCIILIIYGTQYTLGADEDNTCPECGALQTDTTPLFFDTDEAAITYQLGLVERFNVDDPTLSMKAIGFGIVLLAIETLH